jgi:hypothetical protein
MKVLKEFFILALCIFVCILLNLLLSNIQSWKNINLKLEWVILVGFVVYAGTLCTRIPLYARMYCDHLLKNDTIDYIPSRKNNV